MKKKYKIKRLKDFPEHCKESCYAITEYGHTLFPSDVVKKLNELEFLLKQRHERSVDNEELKDLLLWMTGCGYDFAQHEYFRTKRDELLK
jgi:hypothetical protein